MHALKHTIVHMKEGEREDWMIQGRSFFDTELAIQGGRGGKDSLRIMALPTWASVVIALAAALLVAVSADVIYNRLTRKPFKPTGKHCFITGGSTGLGKALAIELIKRGANVTIVARRQSELDKAAKELEVCCRS